MFSRDLNNILNEILMSYKNMSPILMLNVERLRTERPDIYNQYVEQTVPDTSEGTVLFMRAACLAAMFYGLYKVPDKIIDQYFSDTANSIFLKRQASEWGVVTSGKTDKEIAEELGSKKRGRKMGGNKYDYIDWAKSVSLNHVVSNPSITQLETSGFSGMVLANTIDNDTATLAWSTDGVSAGAYIKIDAENVLRLYNKLRLFLSGPGSTTEYEIQYSDNDLDWTTVINIQPSSDGWNEAIWSINQPHRYWRLLLSGTDESGPHVTEMEWSEGPEKLPFADVKRLAQGEGTFDLVVASNLSNGQASADILAAVEEKIENSRTVCSGFSWGLRVLTCDIVEQDIDLTGTGDNWDVELTISEIRAHVNSLLIGQTLYRSQITAIAVQSGADSVNVVTPPEDVVPVIDKPSGTYQVIRAGDITGDV